MMIILKPATEWLINEVLKSGHYQDIDEVIQRALFALKQQEQQAHAERQHVHRTPQEYLITGYDGQAGLPPGAFLLTPHPFYDIDELMRHEEMAS